MNLFAFFKNRGLLLVLGILFILGVSLRFHHYAEFPPLGETADEIAWTWLGASILQTGEPQSWSYFSSYQNTKDRELAGMYFRMVRPAVDHPALFGLIPGTVHTLRGAQWDELPSLKVIRFPMVLIGALSLGTLFWWLSRVRQGDVGIVAAAAIAATAPSWIFLSRLTVSENLLVLIFTTLLLLLSYEKWSKWQKVAVFLLCLSLPLAKISGLALCAGLVAGEWAVNRSAARWKLLAAGSFAGFLALLASMWIWDWSLFLAVQAEQGKRDVGLLTLYSAWFWAPSLVKNVFADAWMTLSMAITFGWLLLRDNVPKSLKKDSTDTRIALLFLSQLAFLLLSIGEHTIHGWYRIVFIPLFTYVWMRVFEYLWKQKSWTSLALILLTLLPQIRLAIVHTFAHGGFEWHGTINRVLVLLAGALVGVSLFEAHLSPQLRKRLWYAVTAALLIAFVSAQSVGVWNITLQRYWEDQLFIEQGIRP